METVSAVGGAILSAAFQSLFDRLTSMDWLKFARQGELLAELDKWKKMLKKIYMVLDDAEEKQWENPLVKMWVRDLRDLAYDVDDVLDELAIEAQSRYLETETLTPASKVRKLISSVFSSMNFGAAKFNCEMVSKIKEISSRLDNILKEKVDLHLVEYTKTRKSQGTTRLPTTSLVNEAKVYGRVKDKKEILERLKAEATDVKLSVIPIVGMGGIGKTTLAQLIYNDASLQYDLKAWVSVGEDFDVYRMTKTILQLGACDKDLNSLQIKLKEKLYQKKFLIVLDDVWMESYDQWTLFCSPFEAGAPGSIIIVTTRNRRVSLVVGTVEAYCLRELSYNDCVSVFAQHALGASNFKEHMCLEEIGREIVKKCQGLPLAAKSLGGLLRGNANRDVWDEVLNSNIWDLPDEKSNVLPALRLSYLHLPSHLKRCFAYCAIFPKGYEFEKNELVLLWMAEGLLCEQKKMKHMEGLGHQYFHDLELRSFFQQSSSNKSQYRMHDLISDLARSVNEEICFNLGDKVEDAKSCVRVRHSSFTRLIYDISPRFEIFYKMKRLRTFLALPILSEFSSSYLSHKVLDVLVPNLKCLRVLSLAGYQFMELPSTIGDLKHLRYLDLSYSEIRRLPESVGKLFNLQTLRLRGCEKLVELPGSIGNLINLQLLDLTGTCSLQELPLQIANLKNLHILSKFIVGKGNRLRVTALRNFCHLQGKLCITGLQNVADVQDVDMSILKEKYRLTELELEWSHDTNGSECEKTEFIVLSSLEPHRNVSGLSIVSYGGIRLPSWVTDPTFTNMVQLKLWNCHSIESMPPLGQLSSLKELSIGGMDGVKRVGVEFYGYLSYSTNAFVCLENLQIENMKNWENWSYPSATLKDDPGPFPNLCKLTLRNCPKLIGELPSFLRTLKKLNIENCPSLVDLSIGFPNLHELFVSKCQETVLKNVSSFTTLSILKIEKILGLVNLQEVLKQTSVALEHLEIVDCCELIYLWQDGSNPYQIACLKHLTVYHCEQLKTLVRGKEGLLPCNLEFLGVYDCNNLVELPNGLRSLTCLSNLIICGCPKLVSFLTNSFPCNLKYLEIRDCDSLKSLPEGILLSGNGCKKWSNLENLLIDGCPSLRCSSFGEFPASLKILSLSYYMAELLLLESLHQLSNLSVLAIFCGPKLESFPGKGFQLPSLLSLTISKCDNLRFLHNPIKNFTSLQNLEIEDCMRLESFPEDGLPPNLTTLKIRNCKSLTQPMSQWGLYRLSYLKRLEIEGTSPSTDVVSFPDDEGWLLPKSLTFLFIIGLNNLESISRGLHDLSSLKDLLILSCPKLKSLPDVGFPATLGFLVIDLCPLLGQRLLKGQGDYWPMIAYIPYVKLDLVHNFTYTEFAELEKERKMNW